MKMTGYIRKFGSYTSEQILRMREDLGRSWLKKCPIIFPYLPNLPN